MLSKELSLSKHTADSVTNEEFRNAWFCGREDKDGVVLGEKDTPLKPQDGITLLGTRSLYQEARRNAVGENELLYTL